MISKDQGKLAFLKLELKSACEVLEKLDTMGDRFHADRKEWEIMQKDLLNKVFELEVLLGIEV